MITKKIIVVALGVSIWYSATLNKKYNNISKKLDMIVEVSDKSKIDSLQKAIMDIGWKNDSSMSYTVEMDEIFDDEETID